MFSLTGLACCSLLALVGATPLDDYVQRPDDNYSWEKIGEIRDDENELTIHQLNMTSQRWRTDEEISQSIWWHYMAVVVPDVVEYTDHAILLISENNNYDDPPTVDNDLFLGLVVGLAQEIGAVVTLLNQIPNQPIRFASDPKEEDRREDHIIAYTWREFIETDGADPEVLVLFPMAKAAVRAMDTVETFAEEELDLTFEHFFVGGGSKRGWTTWLTAAADPVEGRIVGIAPMVFSILNSVENLLLHPMALGGWSFAFNPYWRENLTYHLTEEVTDRLFANIDPYVYKDRYTTLPKYIVSASGDEFFMLHESRLWFQELQQEGPTYFMMLENAQHLMLGHHQRLIRNLGTFVSATVNGYELPQVSWIIDEDEDDSVIVFASNVDPANVTSFGAVTTGLTPDSRDFRLLIGPDPSSPSLNPCVWVSRDVVNVTANGGPYRFMADRTPPENGYRAFFVNAKFNMPDGRVFETTSEVGFNPSEYPFPRCDGDECHQPLV